MAVFAAVGGGAFGCAGVVVASEVVAGVDVVGCGGCFDDELPLQASRKHKSSGRII